MLDLDAPVTRYWPTFGQHGKEAILVRWLLSHRAGLSALDATLTREEVLAWDPVIAAIEAQAPLWPPGTAHAYHTITYGWLVGEVIRRVSGEGVGTFIRRRLAEPLGLRFWVGLPPDERDAVAWLLAPLPDADDETARAIREAEARPVARRAATMGGAFAFPADGRSRHVQRRRHPGGRGPGRQRHRRRPFAGAPLRRLRRAPSTGSAS